MCEECERDFPADLGRFGHHPDPAIDFCVEVGALEGLAYEVEVGLHDRKPVEDRIFKAMMFKVGGDERAVSAKGLLRRIEDKLKAVA